MLRTQGWAGALRAPGGSPACARSWAEHPQPLALSLTQSSLALSNGERARAIAEYLSSSKKRKVEEKDFVTDYVSPGLGGLG